MLSLCFQMSRIERSLSPMDLSSSSCSESPLHLPLPLNKKSTPEPSESYQSPKYSPLLTSYSPNNGVVSPFTTSIINSPESKLLTASTQVYETPSNNPPLDEVSSMTPHNPSPANLEVATSVPISYQTSTWGPAAIFTKDSQPISEASNLTPDVVSSAIAPPKPRVMKGATHSISLSDLFVKATSSVSGFSHIDMQPAFETPEVGNKNLSAPHKPVRKLSPPSSLILMNHYEVI